MNQPLMSPRRERWARLMLAGLAAATALLLAPTPARAHAPSNATLSLVADGTTVQQRWDIALRDLDRVLPLDADDDGRITWGELREAWPQISAVADDGLRLSQPGAGAVQSAACLPGPLIAPRIDDHADGTYAVLERRWQCPSDAAASGLRVDYRLFADSDASHRGLLQWRAGGKADVTTAVLAPTASVPFALPGAARDVTADPSTASVAATAHASSNSFVGFAGFVAEGVHHILIGTDHVLFLLALMLPAVLLGARQRDAASVGLVPGKWTDALLQVAKVVTAFTVAHSITLAIAVLGHADPPSRIVESLIAASVVLAAIDNLRRFMPGARWSNTTPGVGVPPPPSERGNGRSGTAARWSNTTPGAGVPPPPSERGIGRSGTAARWRNTAPGAGVPPPPSERGIGRSGTAARWPMAFAFGLVHGFGFAGALKELGLDSSTLAQSLIGFNLGVELGQLGIVALALPLAWWMRDTRFYRRVVLGGGSVAIAAVAALWFVERAFDLVLMG